MTLREALKVAREACQRARAEKRHHGACLCGDCTALSEAAAVLARLEEKLPKLAMVRDRMASTELWNEAVRRSAPVIGVAVSEIDKWYGILAEFLDGLDAAPKEGS